MLIIGNQGVKKQSRDFVYNSEKLLKPELPSQGLTDMAKVLSFCFQQCFPPFTKLLVEDSSETTLLDIYLTTYFRVRNFKNTLAMRVIFSLKMFKIKSTCLK